MIQYEKYMFLKEGGRVLTAITIASILAGCDTAKSFPTVQPPISGSPTPRPVEQTAVPTLEPGVLMKIGETPILQDSILHAVHSLDPDFITSCTQALDEDHDDEIFFTDSNVHIGLTRYTSNSKNKLNLSFIGESVTPSSELFLDINGNYRVDFQLHAYPVAIQDEFSQLLWDVHACAQLNQWINISKIFIKAYQANPGYNLHTLNNDFNQLSEELIRDNTLDPVSMWYTMNLANSYKYEYPHDFSREFNRGVPAYLMDFFRDKDLPLSPNPTSKEFIAWKKLVKDLYSKLEYNLPK